MTISMADLQNVFILLVYELVIQMDCSQKFDTIVSTVEPYSTPQELYNTETILDSANLFSFVPLVSNMVVTGQLQPNVMKDEDENISLQNLDYHNNTYSKCPINSSCILDINQMYSNCSVNSSCNLDSNDTYSNCSINASCSPAYLRAPTFQHSALTRVIVLLLIALFSLVGNIATLSSILRTGRHSTSTLYMLLFHLALADLLVSLFCILADALWTLSVAWYGGNLLCKGVKFMQMFSLYVSTFVLVLIGFDRLSAVRFPMSRVHAKHRVRMGLVCVWTISGLFSLPQVFIFSVQRGPFTDKDFYQCVTYGFYTAQWQEQLYTTLSLLLMFLLPLLILLSTYIATFRTIASQESLFSERVCRSAIEDARQKILRKAKVRSFLITVVIVCAFLICWTPYYVTMLIFMFLDPSEQMSRDLQEAVFFFGSSTAAINPLIYGAFHLHRHPRSRSRSRSNISSSTTRVDTCSHHFTSRKSQAKRSRGESLSLNVINGEMSSDASNLYKHRYNSVPLCELNNRIILH